VRDYTSQFTITRILVSKVMSSCRCLVNVSNGGRSLFSGFLNCPCPQLPDSNSNSSSWLNFSSSPNNSQSKSLTNQLPQLNLTQLTQFTDCLAYNISAQAAEETLLLYCCGIVALETWFFAKPLFSNCYFITACFAVGSLPSNGSTWRNIMPKVIQERTQHIFFAIEFSFRQQYNMSRILRRNCSNSELFWQR
jgi:hypothetical protein